MHADELHRLDLDIAVHGDRASISIGGELDTATSPRVITAAHDVLEGTVAAIDLDCEDVWFLDSAGVRALMVIHNEALRMGIDCGIVRASGNVSRILDMTGLTGILTRSRAN